MSCLPLSPLTFVWPGVLKHCATTAPSSQLEHHLTVFCINEIVLGYVVYLVNCFQICLNNEPQEQLIILDDSLDDPLFGIRDPKFTLLTHKYIFQNRCSESKSLSHYFSRQLLVSFFVRTVKHLKTLKMHDLPTKLGA